MENNIRDYEERWDLLEDNLIETKAENDNDHIARWDDLEVTLNNAYPRKQYIRIGGEMQIANEQNLALRDLEKLLNTPIRAVNFTYLMN